jgi:chromosome segregation ATPase
MNESTPVNHAADTTATQMIVRAGDPSLVQQAESPDPRTELYARLQTIIETATESVRTLRDENAALKREVADISERNAALDRRLRAATVDLESDERALRESADLLDQLLRGEVAVPQETDGNAEPATPSEMPTASSADDMEAAQNAADVRMAEPEPLPRHGIFRRADR